MLAAAQAYLARGLSVIPLRPKDKRPLLSSWLVYQERLPTEAEILDWWTRWTEANIAIVTGVVSSIVVLDVDDRKALTGKPISPTPTVQTGKGWHYYFQHPGHECPNFVAKQQGLDFRGDGGYVVAPPSIHPVSGKPYEWVIGLDTPLAPVPDWLRPLIKSPSGWATGKVTRGVSQGERNSSMAQLAGRYLAGGLPEEEVLELLLALNQRKFNPPLAEDEVQRTVESIARAEYRQRAAKQLLDPEDYKSRARIAKALADGAEITPDGELPDEEARQAVLEGLSTSLGIRVTRILKYGTEPSTYFLETAGGRIRLGEVKGLIHQDSFRDKLAEVTGHYLRPYTKERWAGVAQRLLDACELLEVGADATESGTITVWLQYYLDDNQPMGEKEWKEAALLGRPFGKAGAIYISLQDFRRYVIHRFTENITRNQLALLLRTHDAESEAIDVYSEGKHSTRKVWRLSE